MPSYQRLSALDRFFLDVETRNTHMHVAATMVFEAEPLGRSNGSVDIDRIRSYIAARLHLIPRYRQRLAYTPIEHHPLPGQSGVFSRLGELVPPSSRS